ncbi:MAG: tRNA (N6-threonylcarbamoyladenosine(37)-N6)-methyltransferase TrmO [Syntrophobacterales bacterium]|nr:tRNA (N6-threonylcarbamoyladenosine(37)-N6)-methyltransferase TrmO [Syntrophobacterales bacterium]
MDWDKLRQEIITLRPIGYVSVAAATVPRHYTVSDLEGYLVVDPAYEAGLRDIRPGQRLVVLFHFHQSPPFTPERLIQKPPHREERLGVFSTCSPHRPNPLGLSILEVLEVQGNRLRVRGLDMYDGTPILDLKPFVPPDGTPEAGA